MAQTDRDIKIQEVADNLRITIYEMPDGSLHQLKPGDSAPREAKIFKPRRQDAVAPHGTDPPPPPDPTPASS